MATSIQKQQWDRAIVGSSPELEQALANVDAVADTAATVLILGESGTGKELIAQAIHRRSRRADKPLVKVNCASIPRELFESEFFGHVKGSFTSAHRDRVGRFELANGGTLFLDEVGEIPVGMQAKLLRVLQESQFERIGDETTRSVDVRVIAATNRDPQKEIESRRFREDLYYRLSVFPIKVPALRERPTDIIPLAVHFLETACREFGRQPLALNERHVDSLRAYDWPGNVRELRNVIERAVILSRESTLDLESVLPGGQAPQGADLAQARSPNCMYVSEAEWQERYRDNLISALEAAGWRISGTGGAAELLGMKPSTLRWRMKSMAIRLPREADPTAAATAAA